MAEISAVNYKADNGQTYREYLLTKMQTLNLMTGHNIELRIKVNRRWEEIESLLQSDDYILLRSQEILNSRVKVLETDNYHKMLTIEAFLNNKYRDKDWTLTISA